MIIFRFFLPFCLRLCSEPRPNTLREPRPGPTCQAEGFWSPLSEFSSDEEVRKTSANQENLAGLESFYMVNVDEAK